jgi:hypothetical protein
MPTAPNNEQDGIMKQISAACRLKHPLKRNPNKNKTSNPRSKRSYNSENQKENESNA